jgi:hypothetical protein
MSKKAVAVRRDTEGEIVAIKWDDGTQNTATEAMDMCARGELPGYSVRDSKLGQSYLRADGNDSRSDNLSMLPEF